MCKKSSLNITKKKLSLVFIAISQNSIIITAQLIYNFHSVQSANTKKHWIVCQICFTNMFLLQLYLRVLLIVLNTPVEPGLYIIYISAYTGLEWPVEDSGHINRSGNSTTFTLMKSHTDEESTGILFIFGQIGSSDEVMICKRCSYP